MTKAKRKCISCGRALSPNRTVKVCPRCVSEKPRRTARPFAEARRH